MKVGAKLLVLVVVLGVVFIGSIVGLLVANTVGNTMSDLERQANLAERQVLEVATTNFELLVSTQTLDRLITDWQTAIDDFDAQLMLLSEHPAIRLVGEQLAGEIDRSTDVWNISRDGLDSASEAIQMILSEDAIPLFRKQGLIDFQDWLLEDQSNIRLVPSTGTAISALRNFGEIGKPLVSESMDRVAEAVSTRSATLRARINAVVLAASALGFAAGLLFALVLSRGLSRRVQSIEKTMSVVAKKDISIRSDVTGTDEIADLGRNLNNTLEVLERLIGSVVEVVDRADSLKDELASGTTESAAAVNQITHNIESLGTELQRLRGTVEEALAATTEIDERIQALSEDIETQRCAISEASDAVTSMNSSIQNVQELTDDRKEGAEALVRTIVDGDEQIQSTNALISGVARDIENVLEVIEIINGIASQTNLLSMNAAIESAHAGEAGRGFAVVAEEIGKLADSAAENASRIDQSLNAVAQKMREADGASRASAESYESIRGEVETFRQSMSEISLNMGTLRSGSATVVEITNRIGGVTDSISAAYAEVSTRSQEINRSMSTASSMTSVVSSGMSEIDNGAKEILQAIHEISELSEQNRVEMQGLMEITSGFTIAAAEGPDTVPESAVAVDE